MWILRSSWFLRNVRCPFKSGKRFGKILLHGRAIIYSDTVSTSSSVVPAFAKRGDLIVCDDGVASPILVGLRLSRAKIIYFKHNDMKDLERVLQRSQRDMPSLHVSSILREDSSWWKVCTETTEISVR